MKISLSYLAVVLAAAIPSALFATSVGVTPPNGLHLSELVSGFIAASMLLVWAMDYSPRRFGYVATNDPPPPSKAWKLSVAHRGAA
jgi:hypothetical protein